MPIHPYLEKVTAFVTRATVQGLELLLFQHPNAGIQLPAGTVEEGETLEDAVLREVAEETGLANVKVLRHLGSRDELPPAFTHVIFRGTTIYSRPDLSSFDWAALRRGIAVRMERQSGDFAQVTYDEGDRYPDPQYISYRITGWVPLDCLAAVNRRHFFHLKGEGGGPDRWQQYADNHLFQPFWASLSSLPVVVEPQQPWLDLFLTSLEE